MAGELFNSNKKKGFVGYGYMVNLYKYENPNQADTDKRMLLNKKLLQLVKGKGIKELTEKRNEIVKEFYELLKLEEAFTESLTEEQKINIIQHAIDKGIKQKSNPKNVQKADDDYER